ncbi:MAG: SDR family oxidoreductase [Lachnospiraceae bacterium]|nr:SDR family oxidoreductase [Lachnospiraceae bacterium]
MNRLLNKVAIITGADGGICGKACELFCQEGAKVIMNDIDPHVEEQCAKIREKGGEAIAVVGDASKRETWDKLLAAAIDNYGTIDICVNGAAVFSIGENSGDWDTITLEALHNVLDSNVDALLHSYQTVLRYMVDHKIRGNFLNFTSSTALGWNGSGFQGYPMSKAAIKNGTLNMVKQVSPSTGIRFNCLAPNFVWTPKTAFLYENERTLGWFKAVTPFPELGKPEDSAWAMVYLCSDEAKYINGVVLPTDGGWTTCN